MSEEQGKKTELEKLIADTDDAVLEKVVEPSETANAQRLSELGVDADSIKELSQEAQTALIPVLEARQSDFSRRTRELTGDLNTALEKLGSDAYQEFLKGKAQPTPQELTPEDGPPKGSSEKEIFDFYARKANAETADKVAAMEAQLGALRGTMLLSQMRETYGEDFIARESTIKSVMEQRPNLGVEEAYFVAKGMTAEEAAFQKVREQVARAKEARTVSGGSKTGTKVKGLEGVDVSKMSNKEAWDVSVKAAHETVGEAETQNR